MTVTLTQLAETQHRADTVQAVTEALRDSTKVLSNETIRDLIHFAKKSSHDFAADSTMPFRVSSQHHENGRLNKQVVMIWNRQLALQQELANLRTYLGFATAEALKAAVEAGKRAPVPVTPVTPVHHVTVSDRDKILELAKERAKEAQAKVTHKK